MSILFFWFFTFSVTIGLFGAFQPQNQRRFTNILCDDRIVLSYYKWKGKGGRAMAAREIEILQPAFFDNFRCIGPACRDNCCHTWEIDIDKEEIGITVEYNDVQGWIDAIRYIADHPEEARRMGENARKLAEERFNLEIFSREIAESLLEISNISSKNRTFA